MSPNPNLHSAGHNGPVHPESCASEAREHILVVDDDPGVRGFLQVLLGARWKVHAAADGAAALRAVEQNQPDLILCDVVMPRMDGLELLRRLRSTPATQATPVILVTAREGEEAMIEGIEAGADDYVTKPFSARELLARVQTRLELSAMRRSRIEQTAALALLESHRRWTESLLDSMPVALVLLELGSGRLLFANRAAREAVGGRLVGGGLAHPRQGSSVTDLEDRPLDSSLLPFARAARGEKLQGISCGWHTDEGKYYLLLDSETLPAAEGKPTTVAITLRDVTELCRIHNDLRRAIGLRDTFLSVASHELRTPLTVLTLRADALVQMAKGAESIQRQTRRLSDLVDRLLDVSNMVAGSPPMRFEELDLAEVVRGVVEDMHDQAERVGFCIAFSTDTDIVGRWDRTRIGQLASNLLNNAIKYGAGQPIKVTVSKIGERARLVIADQGIGVPPEKRDSIFERFERAVSEQNFPGLGLGLWISKTIVQAHGGTITLDSNLGHGTTVTVDLPR